MELISDPKNSQAAKTCPSLPMINCRRSMLSSWSASQRMSSDEGGQDSNLIASDGFHQHHVHFRGGYEQIFKPFTTNKKRFESPRLCAVMLGQPLVNRGIEKYRSAARGR